MSKEKTIKNIGEIGIASFLLNIGIDVIQDHPKMPIPFGLGPFIRARAHEITSPLMHYYIVNNLIEYLFDRPPDPVARLMVATGIMALYTAYEFGIIAMLLHTTFIPDPGRVLDLITVATTLITAYFFDLLSSYETGTNSTYRYSYAY